VELSLQLFSLPSLKAYNKYKVSVHHNEAKISQVTFANFRSKSGQTLQITKDFLGYTCSIDHTRADTFHGNLKTYLFVQAVARRWPTTLRYLKAIEA